MPLNDCLVKVGIPKEIRDYILSKKELHIKNGLDEATAEKNAIHDFKKETAENLVNLHSQLGNKSFEIKPNQNVESKITSSSSEQKEQENAVGQSTGGTQTETNEGKPTTEIAGEGEKNTVGIHHEALGKLAKKLGLPEPETGEVFTPKEYAERGQTLIDNGASPKQIADDFESDGKVNADIISVAKAHLVNLVRSAEEARIKFGNKSEEYNKALKEVQKWSEDVAKPMGTKFGEIGRALQGETDLDTGSFVSVQRAIEENTGKPLTPKESKTVEELTSKVKEQNKIIEDLHKQFSQTIEESINTQNKQKDISKAKKIIDGNKKVKDEDADLIFQSAKRDYVAARVAKAVGEGESIDKVVDDIAKEGVIKPENVDAAKRYFKDLAGEKIESSSDLVTDFADKVDNNFTPEEVKKIWDYAKTNYVDKGKNVNEIIRGVAMDLGLSSKQVLSALEQPKGSRVISDKMFAMQNRRMAVQNKVKEYVQTVNRSKLRKWLTAIPNFFFQKAIFGHGTVGMITHAGLNIFRPATAKIYWPLFFKQFKNSFGGLTDKGLAAYEKSMEHLRNNPLFIVAKRAGVKVDPGQVNDDYAVVKKMLGNIGTMGDRGFNTLKEFRMAYFENEYNRLSDVQKADPATLKEIAKLVNHGTGTSNLKTSDVLNTIAFAPKLEFSKWARVITDPAKAIATFSKWDKASLAEKTAAKIVARKSGELLASYLGALAVNQAMLYAAGSKQSVNFTDPTQKDWLKFKAGDETIDLSGGIIPTSQFVGHLLYLPLESKKELGQKEHRSRIDAYGKTVLDYGFSKLSPFAGTAKDIGTAHDFKGNTMPWSDDKPKNRYAHKLTWKEYIFTQQAPIPFAEGAKDIYQSMHERGMDDAQINDVLTGLLKGFISGGSGAKLGEDYSTEEKTNTGGGGGATGGFHRIKQKTK